jgi:hypothetical protein
MTSWERQQVDMHDELREQYCYLLDTLNLRVDLTLKQRRDSELVTARPQPEQVNVTVQPRRFSMQDAALFAPYHYLNADEPRHVASRIMLALNRKMFGNRARRKPNPERLTALICRHDRGTRQDLHCLFAVPPAVPRLDFELELDRVLLREPFVYRERRVEDVENVAGSILYNYNSRKSRTGDAILYLYPRLRKEHHDHVSESRLSHPHTLDSSDR